MKMKEKKEEMKKKPNAAREGKMCALKELRDLAASMMGEDLDDLEEMKKVTVAAKDKEGLKAGLKKAQELVNKK